MHYTPHAFLNCLTWFSLLCCGNAARLVPSENLSNFARVVGAILEPSLSNERQGQLPSNRSVNHEDGGTIIRRQIDTVPVSGQLPNRPPVSGAYPNQGLPLQYERSYQYRYPPYSQQLPQTFIPGGNFGYSQQLPFNPRFFQYPIDNRDLKQLQPNAPKPQSTSVNANNDNPKGSQSDSANSIQNLDSNVDSKSSAQNRPFESAEFQNRPGNGNQDSGLGNLRVDDRFSAIDYERIRQNYYSDSPINDQRNYYSSFNDVPLNDGPPYRSSIVGRYSGSDYTSGGPGRPGIISSELRSGSVVDDIGSSYFNGFAQGPYRSFDFNPLSRRGESVVGGSDGGLSFSENFGSAFNGPQYSEGFGRPFYSGGAGGLSSLDFGNLDSSLRASAAKETLAKPVTTLVTSQKPEEQKGHRAEVNGK